jgi:hypothetical protein
MNGIPTPHYYNAPMHINQKNPTKAKKDTSILKKKKLMRGTHGERLGLDG